MIRHFAYGWAIALLLFSMPGMTAEPSQLKAFPEANPGMKRLVLQLPHKEREEEIHFKLELRPGKVFETDSVNQYQLGGKLSAKTLKGWGYRYYEYEGGSVLISTLMAVPEDTPTVKRFVSATPLTLSYNSRIPVVIYVPEDIQVQYRVWSAPESYEMFEVD